MYRIVFLVIFLYTPIFNVMGLELFTIRLMPVLAIIVLFKTDFVFLIKYLKWILILILLLLLYTLLIGRSDLSIIKLLVNGFSYACIAYYIINDLYKGKNIFKDLSIVISLNALASILTIINPFFDGLVKSIFKVEDIVNESLDIVYRFFGFSSYGGAVLSTVYAMGVIFGWLYFQTPKQERSRRVNYLVLIAIGLNVAGIVLSGRTGFILILIFLLFLTLKKSLFFKIKYGILITLALIGLLKVAEEVGDNIDSSFLLAINRSLESLRNYNESGNFRTSSSDALYNMYFLPDEEDELLFGKGLYAREKVKIPSDVFYVRFIYYAGLIFFPLLILLFYDLFLKKRVVYKNMEVSYFIIVCFIILNGKEAFFIGVPGWTQCVFLLYFLSGNLSIKQSSYER